jgi:hypothetical protein
MKVKKVVTYYFWLGIMNMPMYKVSWIQCCQMEGNSGVNMVNLADAMTAMMTKWILDAVEPHLSNLHLMDELPSFKYFMLPKVQAKKGSKSWNCVGTSWKALSKLRRKIGYTIMPSSYATSQRHYGNDMFIIVGRARVKFDLKASKA